MPWIFQIAAVVVVGLIVRAAWAAGRPRVAFRIRIRRGEPVTTSGKVTARFLGDIREVARRNNLARGTITGRERPGGVGLDFSRGFAPEVRQQIRNAWGYSGRPGSRSGRGG